MAELTTLKDKFDPHKYVDFHVDQIRAADYTLEIIGQLRRAGQLGSSLVAVEETDVFRLRRGLCLPSSASACINWVKGERIIGDESGNLRIGDIYGIFAPFHGQKQFPQSDLELSKGWLFCTPEGDVYHQAMIGLAESVDVPAMSVTGYKSVREILPALKDGGAIAISLNNRFVPEKTLKKRSDLVREINGKLCLLIESKDGEDYRVFENGRHVVTILDVIGDEVVVLDSYRLPQMRLEDVIFTVPIDEIDKYISDDKIGPSRAILFTKERETLEQWEDIASTVYVPSEIVGVARDKISELSGSAKV